MDLSNNCLKHLPENIGNLNRLKILKLKGNERLCDLPKSVCRVQSLVLLELDCDRFVYPPAEITRQGTDVIIKYICDGRKMLFSTFKTLLKLKFQILIIHTIHPKFQKNPRISHSQF